MAARRIVMAGASGVGKTTLAKKISEIYKIPFISGSYSDLVPETKGMTHTSMVTQDAEVVMRQDYQLLNLRHKKALSLYMNDGSYVTDRSALDSAAYWINKLSHRVPNCETEQFIELCKKVLQEGCDHLIYIPYSVKFMEGWVIEDNNKRIQSPYYQFQLTKVMDGLLDLWGYTKYGLLSSNYFGVMRFEFKTIAVCILDSVDFNERLEMVEEFLKHYETCLAI